MPEARTTVNNAVWTVGRISNRVGGRPMAPTASPGAKKYLAEIWNAEDKIHALADAS